MLVCWSVVGQHCVCVSLLVSCGTVVFVLVCWSVVGQRCVCVGLLVSCGTALCVCWFVGQLWDSVVVVGQCCVCESVVGQHCGCVGLSQLLDSFVFVLVCLNCWTVLTLVFI